MRKYIKAVMLVNGLCSGERIPRLVVEAVEAVALRILSRENTLHKKDILPLVKELLAHKTRMQGLPDGLCVRTLKDLVSRMLETDPHGIIDALLNADNAGYMDGQARFFQKLIAIGGFSSLLFASKLPQSHIPHIVLSITIYLNLVPYVLSKLKLHLVGGQIATKESTEIVYKLMPISCRVLICIGSIALNTWRANDIWKVMMTLGSFALMNYMPAALHIVYINNELIAVMKEMEESITSCMICEVQKDHKVQALLYFLVSFILCALVQE